MAAHRVSWVLHHGPIPPGLLVCHRCDNPKCVNPDHLFLGTPKDNSQDMVRKGRVSQGDRHPYAKLTRRQVVRIRERAEAGHDPKRIARDYRVSTANVKHVIRRHTWKHVIEVLKGGA
jgi:hypothetical protein